MMKTILAAAALAAVMGAAGMPALAARGQMASDNNLRYTRAYLERSIDMLQHDQEDYNGHRVRAIADINDARGDLNAALTCDTNRDLDRSMPVVNTPAAMDDVDRAWERNQNQSNQNLAFTRRYVEKAIDMLQRDAHDYCGYRVKAIASLQAARSQLTEGLEFAMGQSGTSMGSGNMGQMRSDDNLRTSRAYLERAIDMLQHDQADYNGHRVRAIADINDARGDLNAALTCDTNRDLDRSLPVVSTPPSMDDVDRTWERNQTQSNRNIAFTRRYVEKAIDMLQRDAHDYCGYRVKAIAALQAARDQLTDALQSR